MMDGEGVRAIADLARTGDTVEREGLLYSAKKLQPLIHEPKPVTLVVRTLTGAVDYLRLTLEECRRPVFLQVASPKEVHLYSGIYGKQRERDEYLRAEVDTGLEVFPFGKPLPHEEFMIKLCSLFQDSQDLNYVLEMSSKVRVENGITLLHDGVAQQVEVRRGVSGGLKDTAVLRPIVKLKPWRSFREIDQVESDFLYRVMVRNEEPVFAIFEADGGAWRNEAIQRIKQWLAEHLPETETVEILA